MNLPKIKILRALVCIATCNNNFSIVINILKFFLFCVQPYCNHLFLLKFKVFVYNNTYKSCNNFFFKQEVLNGSNVPIVLLACNSSFYKILHYGRQRFWYKTSTTSSMGKGQWNLMALWSVTILKCSANNWSSFISSKETLRIFFKGIWSILNSDSISPGPR